MKTLANALIAFSLVLSAAAQEAAPTSGRPSLRVATRTRTVRTFGDLENKFMTAVQKKDTDTLKVLASGDFELRRAGTPAQPVPLNEWLANELPTYDLREFRISDMAVHMFGDDTAAVSMRSEQKATFNGKEVSGDSFIVDLWTRHAGDWTLNVRYVGPAEPGQPAAKVEDRKPTGKE